MTRKFPTLWASQPSGVSTHITATIRFSKSICSNRDINHARNATTRRKASAFWLVLSVEMPGMSSALMMVTISRSLEWWRSYGDALHASDAQTADQWWVTSSWCCYVGVAIAHFIMIAWIKRRRTKSHNSLWISKPNWWRTKSMLAPKNNLLSLDRTCWRTWFKSTSNATHASSASHVVSKRLERPSCTNGQKISISARAATRWEKPSNTAKSAMKCGILKT